MTLNKPNRDGRITNRNTRRHIRAMLTDMVDRIGYKKTSKYVDWNQNPLHSVITKDDWTQKIVYPEDVTQIELVHDIVMYYADISDDARVLADKLVEQSHVFASTARELRRLLRKM